MPRAGLRLLIARMTRFSYAWCSESRRGHAVSRLGHRCGMLPDIRFAIGAVLASALLIVTAFGLAATVRIAHHQTVSPFESPRALSYADPIDWSARPDAFRRFADPRDNDSLLERLAAIPPDPTVVASGRPAVE